MMAAPRAAEGVRLSALLAPEVELPVEADCIVTGLSADSRTTRPGDLFFGCPGSRTEGARFVDDAMAAGAAAAVVPAPASGSSRRARAGIARLVVPDVLETLGRVADRFYGEPSRSLRVVGVTGTNGKTSVSHFVAQALDAVGGRRGVCGIMGTLGHGTAGRLAPAALTTLDAIATHRALAELRTQGVRDVAMEVSSHALDQRRVAGVRFHSAVFTNLTRDHLDYHGDMHAYAESKRRLFDLPQLHCGIANLDDPHGQGLLSALPPRAMAIGFRLAADPAPRPAERGAREVRTLQGRVTALADTGLALDVSTPWGTGRVSTGLVGSFNASNLLAALGALLGLGVSVAEGCRGLEAAQAPPGRMERYGGGERHPLVVVDYSHTPDSLANALRALREPCRGRLWCVFGCGGDRDRGKRAMMGEVAAELADVLVVTDDNPRLEDGDRIVADVLAGIPGPVDLTVERDRARAIAAAIQAAAAQDIVLVAGKGHEDYQEIGSVRRPFSDGAAVRRALRERAR